MKKMMMLFAALGLVIGLGSGQAFAAQEASDSPSTHTLDSDLSTIDWNSAFCEVAAGESVVVSLTNASGGDAAGLTITGFSVRNSNGTPKKGNAPRPTPVVAVTSVLPGTSVTLMLTTFDGAKSAHVSIVLSNGDTLGVNLHSNPCDPVI
ncbi:MAG: hypothetical protein R3229_11510 [Alphaproteobacteria bacterium]|nr:hypothetical protein [Alphaproteobacteria bacterium]